MRAGKATSLDAENALFAASEEEGVLFAESVLVLESAAIAIEFPASLSATEAVAVARRKV